MIEVFFDGKCGICRKEISYYQRVAPVGIFTWMDIANDPAPLAAHNITQADALLHLHVRDANGRWHIGAKAFFIIWKHLRYWRLLALFLDLPIIRHSVQAIYNWFADYRFNRLVHCQVAKKQLKPHK